MMMTIFMTQKCGVLLRDPFGRWWVVRDSNAGPT
ncbi:MAG: hypothetical protein ACD_6C00674G0001, partial [uncultured bacterium]